MRLIIAALALTITAACAKSQPADAETQPAAPTQVKTTVQPEMQKKVVQVTPVSPDGKPVGAPRFVELSPEMKPADLGLTPVPAN